ncbi:DNA-methyltransferase [Microcella flavibacter]|uniref:DNA-methyltransferase n=1 Tax=Microcella flavibacter TaxID=1804990 RepID=UPI001456DB89|nr:site-specific DNA-methyltransferase [Microcella flavibacter]
MTETGAEHPDAPLWHPGSPDLLVHGDNLAVMRRLPDASMRLIYLDPPFNTGRPQQRRTTSHVREAEPGDATAWRGFGGQSYIRTVEALTSYDDRFADYWAFLAPRLEQAWRLLDERGTLYLHLDYREAHYAKVALDALFGRDCFLNEIIWAYDYGAKSRRRWPTKHDTILVYVKNPKAYFFDSKEVDREPYMAPGLVTAEKAVRGKLPTDVWWHTIVTTTGREKTGYPTQKPLGILRRIVQASTAEGDWVLDPFAGSGTTAEAARLLGRRVIAIDESEAALAVMQRRLGLDVTRA